MYELTHHGILGMKWGKRQGPPYPLGASNHSASEKKAGWKKSLDKEQNDKKPSSGSRKHGVTDEQKEIAKKVAIGAAIVGGTILAAYGGKKLYDLSPKMFDYAKDKITDGIVDSSKSISEVKQPKTDISAEVSKVSDTAKKMANDVKADPHTFNSSVKAPEKPLHSRNEGINYGDLQKKLQTMSAESVSIPDGTDDLVKSLLSSNQKNLEKWNSSYF